MEPTDVHQSGGRASWPERIAFVLALVLLGFILATSANREPTAGGDRVGRRVELVELIAQQQRRTAELAAEAAALEEDVEMYQSTVADGTGPPAELRSQVELAAQAAGWSALRGPGVQVTLRDSELPLAEAENADVNDLVIHEQDLQAVVNALWAGGAEAMSINGQRVLSTSAVRCVGNILLMNGRVHPPPYVIEAIGDEQALRTALERDLSVARLREAVEQFELGYDVVAADELLVPSFSGPAPVSVAEPLQRVGSA